MTVSADDVKKLRESTGAGIMDCKNALKETNGDYDQAVDYLRKKGIAKAEKKASREAKDGSIESYIHPGSKLGVILEINCETDFVAKTDDFKKFVSSVAVHIAEKQPKDVADLNGQPFMNGKSVEEIRKEIVGKLGENITIKRFEIYPYKNGLIEKYIHPGSKLGVLVEVNTESDAASQSAEFKNFIHDIAMQIAASNPLVVKRDELSPQVIEREMNIYKTQAQEQKKPEAIAEKIALGKMSKFYEEVCLMEQSYIKDPNVTIQDLLKQLVAKVGQPVVIRRFVRYQLGQN
ncbi:MAG: translation elongation factor Ts [Candidatus Zhuqueibacterota bacterium]